MKPAVVGKSFALKASSKFLTKQVAQLLAIFTKSVPDEILSGIPEIWP